jgi:DNA (cytosine-5)-methyltransferase 1
MEPVSRLGHSASVRLRVIDMFAGIGGFSLGLHRAGGFETVAVAELDPYASKVLALRFPDAPNVGDVTTAEYPDADIICAGFPCQDISFAGAGAGLAGSRSGLFWEVVRAVRVVRPKLVLLENVAALLSRGLDAVVSALAEVGYDAEWHCIPASAVGAPHRRDRIWIIAHPRGEQHEVCRAPFSGAIAEEFSRAIADAAPVFGTAVERGKPDGDYAGAREMADTSCRDAQGIEPRRADTEERARQVERSPGPRNAGRGGQWSAEPNVGRVAHGVPKRVDRLRCLGNAVVQQIPELLGRAIAAAARQGGDVKQAPAESPQSGGEAASPEAQAPSEHERRGS